MKYQVNVVENGFILKVINYGLGTLKEPFEKETYVFSSFEDLNQKIEGFVLKANPKAKIKKGK